MTQCPVSVVSAKRMAVSFCVSALLTGCGFVPPVPLHGAPMDPAPSATGIVDYGEILSEELGIEKVRIRAAGGGAQTSDRAVIVLPSGDYVFELEHPTGETRVTDFVDADGNYFSMWEEVFETISLDVTVSAGRCYRVFRIGEASEERYRYEDYWPTDREDITPYCPGSRR